MGISLPADAPKVAAVPKGEVLGCDWVDWPKTAEAGACVEVPNIEEPLLCDWEPEPKAGDPCCVGVCWLPNIVPTEPVDPAVN